MNQPDFFDNSLKIEVTEPKRKRKFKIFDGKSKQQETDRGVSSQSNINGVGLTSNPNPNPKKILSISKPIQIAKIAPKTPLQVQFYGEDEQEDDIVLLDLPMDAYQTVKSNKFGESDTFKIETPSIMLRNNCLVINQASVLYRSVQTMKQYHSGLQSDFQELRASVASIDCSVRHSQSQIQSKKRILYDIQIFLESVKMESQSFDAKIKDIDRRIGSIEKIIVEQQAHKEKENKQKEKDRSKKQQIQTIDEEIKVFIEEDGTRIELNDQEQDEFVESHFVPGDFISKYLQSRQLIINEQIQNQKKIQQMKTVGPFHPIYKIYQEQYKCLTTFLLEELPSLTLHTISFRLLFRRGTTDLDSQSIGDHSNLQYTENLLFLIKTSTGKRIGGYISNFLIQESIMDDPNAFIFTLQDHGHKFPIKQECNTQAFTINRFYLITFSNDLMISRNCLQQYSYCEWPTSYSAFEGKDNIWLAGDFEFMIEHIEIYHICRTET